MCVYMCMHACGVCVCVCLAVTKFCFFICFDFCLSSPFVLTTPVVSHSTFHSMTPKLTAQYKEKKHCCIGPRRQSELRFNYTLIIQCKQSLPAMMGVFQCQDARQGTICMEPKLLLQHTQSSVQPKLTDYDECSSVETPG